MKKISAVVFLLVFLFSACGTIATSSNLSAESEQGSVPFDKNNRIFNERPAIEVKDYKVIDCSNFFYQTITDIANCIM